MMILPRLTLLLLCVVSVFGSVATPATSADKAAWNWYFASPSRNANDTHPVSLSSGTAEVTFGNGTIKIDFKDTEFSGKVITFFSDKYSQGTARFVGVLTGMSSEGSEPELWLGQYRELADHGLQKRTGVLCTRKEILLRPALVAPNNAQPIDGDQVVPDGEVIALVQQQVGRCGEIM